MRFRSTFTPVVLALAFFIWAGPASAYIETMTVSELQPGMRGVGRTVIKGTDIVEFDCEIIDVFTDMGYNGGPLIFLRISGPVIDETGGIAGGFSGSPVFIDGKLIGALSWGAYYTKGDVVGATPINEMMKAFTYPEEEAPRISREPVCLDNPINVAGREYDSILLADSGDDCRALDDLYGGSALIMTPCRTPLIVSGLSQRGFERLKEFADERLPCFDLVQGPGGGSTEGVPILLGPTVLEPGASIGAQLASGDLDITAVGTLTWIDEDGRFLAFGHPFLMDGKTDLPFLTTKIVYTMPSLDRSYKLGEPIEVVGTITQDRSTCIAGQLRQIPRMVNFHLEVVDRDLDRTRRFNYSIVDKQDWLPFLGYLVPMEGLMYGNDRMGPATCKIGFSIRGEGLAEPVERENLMYAAYGPSEALGEFFEALNMLTSGNSYRDVRITDVEIRVETTSARQTVDIIRARFQNPPNMGPGAIGYTGPQTMEDKAAKDQMVTEQAQLLSTQNGGAQPLPLEGMIPMDYMGMMNQGTTGVMPPQLVGYRPGDTIELLVTLRPWRQDPVEQVVELTIPDDFPVGQTSVEIMGGTSSYYMGGYYMAPMMGDSYFYGTPYLPPEDLDQVIEEFVNRDTGNTLVARILRIMPTEDPYYYLQDEYEPPEDIETSVKMGDIVYGYYTLPVEIISETGETAATEPPMPEDYTGFPGPTEESGSEGGNPYRN